MSGGETKITFGRHKGKRFMDVLGEKEYCKWIVDEVGERAKGNLKLLQDFLVKTRIRKPVTPSVLKGFTTLKVEDKDKVTSSDTISSSTDSIEEKEPLPVKVNKKNIAQFLKKRKDDLTSSRIQNFNEDLTASTFFEMEI